MTIIGITMGCPVGIGPEIILRYFHEAKRAPAVQPVVLGDRNVLNWCGAALDLALPSINWTPGSPLPEGGIPVVELSTLAVSDLSWGCPDRSTGRAMSHYIEKGVELTRQGVLDGLVTCPISKTALNDAGYRYPGHTEMLADLTGTTEYGMMMAGSKLRVSLVTIHCPLGEVSASLTKESVLKMIRLTHRALTVDFGIHEPRIGVAGFNPHGGENKLFGSEEEQIIGPAVEEGKKYDIDLTGPHPPDTVFYKAASGGLDAVVCMYHDQGLIPFKLLHFEDGVNVTLGLPIVRTSVDHGTAYDIAGKGLASHRSLREAVSLASKISQNRAQHYSPGA
ncbi:MAG: 4-hydroxythreonine-4-phosphate dehydrogenase PdxA [Desulforhopalus sp.]